MHFEGVHTTRYDYTDTVFLEPHTIRLRPRSDPSQIVRAYSIDIDPKPEGLTDGIDASGNEVTWAWFSDVHRSLEITTRFVVDTVRENPFDFVVPAHQGSLPVAYGAQELAVLEPYLSGNAGATVGALAEDIARSVDHRVMEFATELADQLHSRCEMIVRPLGDPLTGEQTLAAGQGSCRDIAVLCVEACRHVGLAARFVSGYVEQHPEGQPRELHAWTEVYIPGGGWRAFDPSQGLAVTTGHVTLAAAAFPSDAAPVTGSFRSSDGATATLTTTVSLDVAA